MLTTGISFAVWNYNFLGEANKIETGEISLELLESNTDIINIENALPMGDNEGKTQDKTFDFQVRTKTLNKTDIGYSLILERVQTLCGDLDNPNKDDYPECYNTVISDIDKDKLISFLAALFGVTTEKGAELYNAIIAHDKEGIYNFAISLGVSEEAAQGFADEFESNGYEVYLIDAYQQQTGETITPTYEFDNTKTYGNIDQLRDEDVKIYLEDYQGNILLEPTKISEISSDYVIYTKINSHDSTNENIKDKYKLRVWIDGKVDSSDWTATEKHEYKFKIGVKTKLKESDVSADENPETSDLKYTVKYNANGGEGTMENSTFVYNQTGKLSKNTFTKEHYTFKGWSTKSNSTEVVYNDEAEVKNLTDVYHGVVNLYAVWKINSYDVNVVVQNGTISGETSKQVEYNQTTTFNVMANINYGRPTISCTNGQSATIENGIVTTGKITNDTTCTVTYIANPIVNVVVQNGTVDTGTKSIEHGQNGIFNLTPEVSGSLPTVTCTNSQTGSITNNVLTVSNVTNDTICTVKYITEMTTLYADGTLIINENLANRSSNITTHGAVTNEYDAMSSSNSYVMSSYSSQPWTNEKESITAVEIGSEIQPVSTNYWAYGLENMTTGDFTKLDTSSVTSMSWMFSFAGSSASTFNLTGLNNWDTSSVTNMSYMFASAGKSRATTFKIEGLSG